MSIAPRRSRGGGSPPSDTIVLRDIEQPAIDALASLGIGASEPAPSEPVVLAEIRQPVVDMFARLPGLGSGGRSLRRSELANVDALPLWISILRHTEAIGFDSYQRFINQALLAATAAPNGAAGSTRELSTVAQRGLDPYQLLRTATEAFLLRNSGVWNAQSGVQQPQLAAMLVDPPVESGGLSGGEPPLPGSMTRLPETTLTRGAVRERLLGFLGADRASYIDFMVERIPNDPVTTSPFSPIAADPTFPCLLELIWSYWHEEGMLSQTLNAIALRFQNVRHPSGRDPLGEYELDPLRPLSSLLWSHVNAEPQRLSVLRRAYEYNHHYGLTLLGRATRGMRPADQRKHFLEAFHNLLRLCAIFYTQDDDTTVISDGFPVLSALKEVHLILAEGAHNQFRDLPWTSRAEMLMEQWFMARPEMRDFLHGRFMVPYVEDWMGGVDAMKRLQGWTDVSVTHFHDLAVFSERLFLSIRHYLWGRVVDQEVARTWARYFRPEIQGYVHAYRAATGVDLSNPDRVDSTLPAIHLQRRLDAQRRTRVGSYARQSITRAPRPSALQADGDDELGVGRLGAPASRLLGP